jgi:hypothetical protein
MRFMAIITKQLRIQMASGMEWVFMRFFATSGKVGDTPPSPARAEFSLFAWPTQAALSARMP